MRIVKSKIAVGLAAAVTLGGGAVAWADVSSQVARPGPGPRPACTEGAGVVKGQPPTDAQRAAILACLKAAGVAPGDGKGRPHEGMGPKAPLAAGVKEAFERCATAAGSPAGQKPTDEQRTAMRACLTAAGLPDGPGFGHGPGPGPGPGLERGPGMGARPPKGDGIGPGRHFPGAKPPS